VACSPHGRDALHGLNGFCHPCFATQSQDPTDVRSRNYKSKEVEFARRIATRFPQFDWRSDKRVLGCSEPHGPRPDAMPTGFALPHAAGDVAYDVENDEFSHRDRTCESERRKLVETLRRSGKKYLVVFRFNQDEYRDAHGVRVPSSRKAVRPSEASFVIELFYDLAQ
jgi:hypothetical protein